jgi:Spy/CpxP family protein refolding chaperone
MKSLILTVALAAALPLAAQPHRGMGMGPGFGGPGGDPALRLERLGTVLDLTDAQKTAARALFDKAKQQSQPAVTALRQGHQTMQAAITGNKSDAEINNIAAAQAKLTAELSAIHAKTMRDFRNLLTNTQREKMDQLHAQMPGPGRQGRRGGAGARQ